MSKISRTLKVFSEVYYQKIYKIISLVVFIFSAILVSFFQNYSAVFSVFGYPLSGQEKASLVLAILGNFYHNLKGVYFFTTVLILALFSINITLVIYYFKKRKEAGLGLGVGFGALFGLLGAGCAACGGVILSLLASLVGLPTLFYLLPFGGLEFSVIAIVILVFSIRSVSLKISAPNVC